MRHTPERHTDQAEHMVKYNRCTPREKHQTENNFEIVLAGLRPSQWCKHNLPAIDGKDFEPDTPFGWQALLALRRSDQPNHRHAGYAIHQTLKLA